jgi:hypothetical protein
MVTMRHALVGAVLGLALAAPGWAQGAADDQGPNPLAARFGLRASYVSPGDFGSGLGAGADVTFGAGTQKWMVGVEWADSSLPVSVLNPALSGYDVPTNLWGLTVTWLNEQAAPSPRWSWGLGLGWYQADSWQINENHVGAHALARLALSENWFAEARYVLGTKFGDDLDMDGFRASLGYAF